MTLLTLLPRRRGARICRSRGSRVRRVDVPDDLGGDRDRDLGRRLRADVDADGAAHAIEGEPLGGRALRERMQLGARADDADAPGEAALEERDQRVAVFPMRM